MVNKKLNINGFEIDYDFLGTYPSNIETFKENELIDFFIESYKYSFISTVFTYYGNDLLEIRNIISDGIYSEDYNYKELGNKKRWNLLTLVVLKMFFEIHDFVFAINVIDEVFDNFDTFAEDEFKVILNDLNFSLFFSIEELLSVSPSNIRELKSSQDDEFLLPELLDIQKELELIIKDNIKEKDIKKETYIDFFKEPINKNYYINLFDMLISTWVELLPEPKRVIKDKTEDNWNEYLADVYSIICACFSILLKEEEKIEEIANLIYFKIASILSKKLKIKFSIPSIELY